MPLAGHDENYTYFMVNRSDMKPFIPTKARRVLDVGCDQGGFAQTLRSVAPDAELVGIEPVPASADAARAHYSRVIDGLFPEALDREMPDQRFDTIFFNDVLEHMPDPWGVLADTKKYLTADGHVVASIPNIQYLPVVLALAFRGRFKYADFGVLDRTHLRFFTRKSMIDLFEGAGFVIERMEGMAPFPAARRRRYRPLKAVRPLLRNASFMQFAIVARIQHPL